MKMTEEHEVQRLRTAVQELTILNEIATAVSSARDLAQVVDLIIKKCVKHLKVEQGAVLLLDQEVTEKPFRTMVRKVDSNADVVPYHFGQQLSGWMLKNQKPLLINDFREDDRFRMDMGKDFPIRSLLSVPLRSKGHMLGLLNVFNKRLDERFTSDDQRLLSIISTQSAQVIENARLYEDEQALRRMEEELRVAYEIQMNLLPTEAPEVKGYDMAGRSVPATEVGGDYYDFIPISDHRLAICLGDVSGKGMPAALLMANLQATLRGQTPFSDSCQDCVQRANKLLFQSTDIKKFATLFYGILDTRENQFCYSNAGHDPPILFSRGKKPRRLRTGGIVLGFMDDFAFEQDVIRFDPADVLVVYSDGITEAMNASEEEFGEERLASVVGDHVNSSPDQIIETLVNEVYSFTGDTPQFDDITLLIIKRNEE